MYFIFWQLCISVGVTQNKGHFICIDYYKDLAFELDVIVINTMSSRIPTYKRHHWLIYLCTKCGQNSAFSLDEKALISE